MRGGECERLSVVSRQKGKTYSIEPSHPLPDDSTTSTRPSLTSLFGWEAVTLGDVAACAGQARFCRTCTPDSPTTTSKNKERWKQQKGGRSGGARGAPRASARVGRDGGGGGERGGGASGAAARAGQRRASGREGGWRVARPPAGGRAGWRRGERCGDGWWGLAGRPNSPSPEKPSERASERARQANARAEAERSGPPRAGFLQVQRRGRAGSSEGEGAGGSSEGEVTPEGASFPQVQRRGRLCGFPQVLCVSECGVERWGWW